ncbi:hypothetical protein [Streptosporangium amethystogenes]|nr:hypothetical protein [Streptosporangium amethystogenes]
MGADPDAGRGRQGTRRDDDAGTDGSTAGLRSGIAGIPSAGADPERR